MFITIKIPKKIFDQVREEAREKKTWEFLILEDFIKKNWRKKNG